MAGGRQWETTVEYTPTWVVAVVCTIIVSISLAVERALHYTGKYLKRKNQKPLFEALQKIKEELMLLGFISLLLTVSQGWISKICMPKHLANQWLPCKNSKENYTSHVQNPLFSLFNWGTGCHLLAKPSDSLPYCESKGKVPLLSATALHHLHVFIFVLAAVHVTFCALTILFGGAQIRRWKQWEDSIAKNPQDALKNTFTHVQGHDFIKGRFLGIGKTSDLLSWLHSFVKQFYGSVTKSDYTTLRLGFITTHCRGNPKFNFHKYMVRALEADFKKVVGISWYLWLFVAICLFNCWFCCLFTKEYLLSNVLSAIPEGVGREEWLQALPRALVAGFVKTDIEFQTKGETSGTTVTFVVIDGWTVTVASVGDSRCILDTQGGIISLLTVDHRLEENVEERERVTASGGEVGRLNIFGGNEVGPLRCWPGGLCLSRSIGDTDVGEFIVPIPHVKQVKLSNAGGRLIIASDGIWDALSSDMAANCCRLLSAELAAKTIVKEALRSRGLKDDTTCLVVDMNPSDYLISPPAPLPRKKPNLFSSLILRKSSHNSANKATNKLSAVGAVEELFEEGSAVLAERLGKDCPQNPKSGFLKCAVCQVDQPSNGLTANSDQFVTPTSKTWEGPLLCTICRTKKDAMEGKRANKNLQ